MYIDKLYNKLYAGRDLKSLNILYQELKLFSEEGGVIDQYTKNMQRSIANKLTKVTKTVGKMLAVGIPVAGVLAYLNRSEAGRDWLKENTGFDYDKTKDNLSDKWDQLTGNDISKRIPKDLSIPAPISSEPEEVDEESDIIREIQSTIPEASLPGMDVSDSVPQDPASEDDAEEDDDDGEDS